jgi:long-subunit acyl-CoA synthetase (AMP-forming)
MTAAAGAKLAPLDGFHWLAYHDLGRLVARIASRLRRLDGLDGGRSYVAISGYNDFEFACADFAVAAAGMVSVGIHSTYGPDAAVGAIAKVECACLLYMTDMALEPARRGAGRWCVQDVAARCPSVKQFVVMDGEAVVAADDDGSINNPVTTTPEEASVAPQAPVAPMAPVVLVAPVAPPALPPGNAKKEGGAKFRPTASFLDWVSNCCRRPGTRRDNGDAGDAADDDDNLPDPFDCRGAKYTVTSTRNGQADPHAEVHDCHTILFTSGSSGTPKAVAVGVGAFVHDIAGLAPDEAAGSSQSITVSYIALSHSSDRYKVWQHVVHGGRVGFAEFGAENWEWRERDKDTGAAGWSGVGNVRGLFRQVAALRPTSMAMPPNIWSGLHQCYRLKLAELAELDAADAAVAAGGEGGTGGDATADAEREEVGGWAANAKNNEGAAMDYILSMFGQGSGIKHRMKHAATGGAPTPPADLAFAGRVCRAGRFAFVNSYGVTEAGAIASDGRQIGAKFSDIGIRLDTGASAGTGEGSGEYPYGLGEVLVSTPALALGYQGDPAKTAKAFIEEWDSEYGEFVRWFRTGDLARLDNRTGELTLVDRVSSIVRTPEPFGTALLAGECENDLESEPFVHNAVLFVDDEQLESQTHRLRCVVNAPPGTERDRVERSPAWRKLASQLAEGEPAPEITMAYEAWTAHGDGRTPPLLTVTLKKNRKAIAAHYAAIKA